MRDDMIDVDVYFDRYLDRHGLKPGRVEAVGQTYRAEGHLDREQLQALVKECSTHSARHVKNNHTSECIQVTADVPRLRYDFSKVSVLCGLKGIQAPTASFVLTALDPLNHAIVNKQVQASLQYLGYIHPTNDRITSRDYATMIRHIRTIADEEDCTAAAVGYALSAHGSIVQEQERDVLITPTKKVSLIEVDSAIDTDVDSSPAPATA